MDSYQNRIEKYSDFIQFQTTYDKSVKSIKKNLNEKSIDSQMNILEDGQTDGQTHRGNSVFPFTILVMVWASK